MQILSRVADLATVDPDDHQHGLLGRLARTLENFGQEAAEHHAAAAEVRAGHLLVAMTVSEDAEKDLAASTLRGQGARRLRYWGRWEIEKLSP
jgi:hypothetical protein